MNSFNVAELKEKTYFTSEVILDKTFLLLNNSLPVTTQLLRALTDWNFKQVYSNGTVNSGTVQNIFSAVSPAEEPHSSTGMTEGIKKAMADSTSANGIEATEASRLGAVQKIYIEYLNYIGAVYTRYATHKELNLEEISSTVKDFCVFIKDNRRYVLRIQPSLDAQNKNFLISHSMRSTVLAITIGLQLRLPLSKLIELGVACILHEIGMIRLPPQLYMTDRMLTVSEKNIIYTHPVMSYNILKSYDFPLSICLAVLEHHEKENGNGYPRHIKNTQISVYAKIISVACSFEAITAPRHYKEAQSSHDAMVEMLKNSGQQYDETVMRALLLCLSLYPIGAYVYLSNGKIAQVTEVNPEAPKNPIVQIFNEKDAHGEPITIQTDDKINRIIRALDKKELEDLLKTAIKTSGNAAEKESV